MKKGMRLRVDGTFSVRQIDDSERWLPVLQEAVGGYVEAVDLVDAVTMWCNEEGKVLNLERNDAATRFLRNAFPGNTDYIAGDVFFTGLPDEEGETKGLTGTQIHILSTAFLSLSQLNDRASRS